MAKHALPCNNRWGDLLATPYHYLSPAERSALEEHVASCPDCAVVYAQYREMDRMLKSRSMPVVSLEIPHQLREMWEAEALEQHSPQTSSTASVYEGQAQDTLSETISHPTNSLPDNESGIQQTERGRILDGNLETTGVQVTLKLLAMAGKTGKLIVTSGQETLSLYLNEGQIVAHEDNFIAQPDLLNVMCLLWRISKAKVVKVRRKVGTDSPAMLEELVKYRVISEEEMLQWQEYGVIQALSRALGWQRGRFEFHSNIVHDAQLALNVDHVLLESLRQADEWDEAAIGLSHTALACWKPGFTGDIKGLALEPDEVDVLCLASGRFSLQAIAYALLLSEVRVAQILDHLLAQELIEMAGPAVLVVDDSPAVRKIVQLTLQRENMRVLTASDGLHALALVADEDPDLILLDIMLPRMDGYNICRIIRDKMEFRHIPIIMLSGKDGIFEQVRGQLAGASGYITKPFDTAELVQLVKKHLASVPARKRRQKVDDIMLRLRRWNADDEKKKHA